jgi:glucokinase
MPNVIALDMGGTQIRAALVDADGTVTNRVTLPTPATEGADAVITKLAQAVYFAASGATDIIGVGLSSPGPLDTDNGIAIDLPNIKGLRNFPLREALSQKLGRAVHLENDGIAAAIGEWKFGAGKGLHSLVYVTVSTGIGGGVIVNDTVIRGRMGMASHVGHMSIMPGGLRCNCGNTGCWEAYASGPAFAARASKTLGKSLQPTDVFELARTGDTVAKSLVEEEANLLGLGLTSLLYLFSPEKIIIGGGLSNAADQLFPGITDYIQANAMAPFRDVPVVTAGLGGNSGLIGAAALVFAAQ